jgi:hypothetical protein
MPGANDDINHDQLLFMMPSNTIDVITDPKYIRMYANFTNACLPIILYIDYHSYLQHTDKQQQTLFTTI